jgi:hypothetical protein
MNLCKRLFDIFLLTFHNYSRTMVSMKKKAKPAKANMTVSVVLPVAVAEEIKLEAERQQRKLAQLLRILISERWQQINAS